MPATPIYLDYNATTPVDRRVADAMTPYLFEHFGNPSSSHAYGVRCREAVERARAQVAGLVGCTPDQVVFTSGGTESNNMAILGVAEGCRGRGNHIITTAIEHPAVTEPCRYLERHHGFRLTVLPVDGDGLVSPADVAAAIEPDTVLISVMHAQNEVGTLQPVAEIAAIARLHQVLMHTDAAQSAGKVPVALDLLGVDFISVAGHKFHAPKGVGALIVRQGVTLPPLLHGAGQERNRRPGTENVLEIVGLGAAAEIALDELEAAMEHSRSLRDRLWQGLESRIPGLRLNGHPTRRLPNTLSVCMPGVEASVLLARLAGEVAASAGAACHAAGRAISAVLAAMDVPAEHARGALRLSVGRLTTPEEIDRAVDLIAAAL